MRMIHLNCKVYRVKEIEKLYQHYINRNPNENQKGTDL
jgi:hypothetical protein